MCFVLFSLRLALQEIRIASINLSSHSNTICNFKFYARSFSYIKRLLNTNLFENRWISDKNRNRNKLAYFKQFYYSYSMKIAKLYVISQLICDSFSIGNPPNFQIIRNGFETLTCKGPLFCPNFFNSWPCRKDAEANA